MFVRRLDLNKSAICEPDLMLESSFSEYKSRMGSGCGRGGRGYEAMIWRGAVITSSFRVVA